MFVLLNVKKSGKDTLSVYTDNEHNEVRIFFHKNTIKEVEIIPKILNKEFDFKANIKNGKLVGIKIRPNKDYLKKSILLKEFIKKCQEAESLAIEVSKLIKQLTS